MSDDNLCPCCRRPMPELGRYYRINSLAVGDAVAIPRATSRNRGAIYAAADRVGIRVKVHDTGEGIVVVSRME